MKSFVRVTKLPSISGRAGYMSDPGKQEEIVVQSEPVDWQPYIDYEATQRKTNARQNEGREVMVTLSNDWYGLPKDELRSRVDQIAKAVVGEGRDYQWAVHWNKNRTNLHVHIIFSERQRVKEPAVWDRDIYLRDDGKVARKKSERAKEPDGSFKPPIHKKGDLKSDPFTAKDTSFKSKEWLHTKKQELRQLMEEQWGVKFEKQPHLAEFHEGKGSEAPFIQKKNEIIRKNNERLDFMEERGLSVADLVAQAKSIRYNSRNDPMSEMMPVVIYDEKAEKFAVEVCFGLDQAEKVLDSSNALYYEKVVEAFIEAEAQKPAPARPAAPEPVTESPEPVQEIQVSDKEEKVEEGAAAPVDRKSIIEVLRDTISAFIAQIRDKAAQKAAEEQAKKAAEEQAKKDAEAQRATEVTTQQQLREIPEKKPEKERKPSLDSRIAAANEPKPSEKGRSMADYQAEIDKIKQQTSKTPKTVQRSKSKDRGGYGD